MAHQIAAHEALESGRYTVHRFIASYLATYVGPARPGHCLRLSWIQSSRSLSSRRIDSGLGSILARPMSLSEFFSLTKKKITVICYFDKNTLA